jgi:hypothetical protein
MEVAALIAPFVQSDSSVYALRNDHSAKHGRRQERKGKLKICPHFGLKKDN